MNVGVGAVGRLVDELNVPAVRGSRRHHFRVVVDAMGRCVVLLHQNFPWRSRPPALDGRKYLVHHLPFVNLLRYLDRRRLHGTSGPVSAVSLSLHLSREGEDADLATEVAVSHGIVAWSRYCCEEQHLLNV